MKRRVALLLFAVLAAAGLSVGPAAAKSVLVVDDDLIRGNCRFGEPDYHTIQQAVTEAPPGARIWVCPGEYVETVVVTKKGQTIKGAMAGVDARWRNGIKGESIVTLGPKLNPVPDPAGGLVQLRADGITWDGFLVADNTKGPGIFTSEKYSGYEIRNTIFNDNGLGLYLSSNGLRQTNVRTNRFHANNEFLQPGAGVGIYSDRGAQCILIADNLFEEHNEAGILFADSIATKTSIWVKRNKSIDDRTFAAFYASSQVHLLANTVRSDRSELPPPNNEPGSAIFIGARSNDVEVAHNQVKSTDGNGIDVRDSTPTERGPAAPENVDIRKNKVRNAGLNGIDIDVDASGADPGVTQYRVRGNRASNNGIGIHVGPDTTGASLSSNTALDNDTYDCQDESTGGGTAGRANTWTDNVGRHNSPGGICAPDREHKHHKKHHKNKKKHHKHQKKQHHHEPQPCLPCGRRPI